MYRSQGRAKTDHVTGWFDHHPEFGIRICFYILRNLPAIPALYIFPGEGHFAVAPNKKLPFVVATNHLDICVLGTEFNLQAYPFDRKRQLLHWSPVLLLSRKKNQPNSFITLEPNQQLDYENRSGRFNKTDIDASVYSGWTKGEMNFISQSLREILRTLERSYAVSIQLSSDLMESNRINSDLYTIKFKRRDDIFHVLDIVTKTVGGITYKVEKDESISICPLK